MELDRRIYSQARLTRDARFDGKFFIGVRSSRVYCRPICPARTAKEENCTYFLTAAAAAEAGYRPCLRCRPELSPGTPAWSGTSTTVSRALRLISESALEDGGVEALAERLGIGARHLRRLFLRHLGATPMSIAKTQRLHFAKKLIDETQLPFGEIALAAGFGSVRRFNSAFRTVYKRTPTEIRRLAHLRSTQPENEYCFRLRYRPPYHWEGLVAFLAPRATPGVEVVQGGIYQRTIVLDGQAGTLAVSLSKTEPAVEVRISFPESQLLFVIMERVRRMFDLTADPREIATNLSKSSVLAERVASMPGLRVPGCWDGFELAVRAILGQQVSVKGATTLAGRLAQKFGKPLLTGTTGLTHTSPTAESLAEADVASIGLPEQRGETIRALARAVCAGHLAFGSGDVEDFKRQLKELPGIGEWTAQYIAMRAMGEPDAFPASDLGLLRVAGVSGPKELERMAEAWRPWRAYAAMYLWQATVKPSTTAVALPRIDSEDSDAFRAEMAR